MAFTYKVLGQVAPADTNDANVYTVPASTSAVVSTISVANITGTDATFDISIRPAGATKANLHYVAKGVTVPANDTVFMTVGATLATTDVVTVASGTANAVSFNVYGSEIS